MYRTINSNSVKNAKNFSHMSFLTKKKKNNKINKK